jgi:hypothetical protein
MGGAPHEIKNGCSGMFISRDFAVIENEMKGIHVTLLGNERWNKFV